MMLKRNTSSATKAPANALLPEPGKHIITFEYVCPMFARIVGMFGIAVGNIPISIILINKNVTMQIYMYLRRFSDASSD